MFKSRSQNLFCALKSAPYHHLRNVLIYAGLNNSCFSKPFIAVQRIVQEPKPFRFTLLDHLTYYV